MTAKEAQKLVHAGEPQRAEQRREAQAEYDRKAREAERLKQEQIDFAAAALLKKTYDEIRLCAQDGRAEYRVLLRSGYLSDVDEGAADNVVKRLELEGYFAMLFPKSVFTGVDEWYEDYYLVVRWGSEMGQN